MAETLFARVITCHNRSMNNSGLIISAPASGSGKTMLTLGLLRALRNRGLNVRAAKSGPDYIDPRFHEAACGRACVNLDAWAMEPARIKSLAQGDGLLIVEGAMGLFDGAPPQGRGATADLARILDLPVLLVVDAARQAQSVAALVSGFARHDKAVTIAGVILNNVGSQRHETMLRKALKPSRIPVLGAVMRHTGLELPSRHLGLRQAQEHPELQDFIRRAAEIIEAAVDVAAVKDMATNIATVKNRDAMLPPAQTIAVAQDRAFAFAYPHLLSDWRAQGAHISFFSPLNDEAPERSEMIFLPGGYPELYAGKLAAARNFTSSLRDCAKDTIIYGECGGYMVLGHGMIDATGARHAMVGLLGLESSFETRKLHLGYRHLHARSGPVAGHYRGHEFHYATTVKATGDPLFTAEDAEGIPLRPMGLLAGRVCGSFAHIIEVHD